MLTVNGVADPNLSVDPNATDDGLDATGDGWSMRVDGLGPDGKPLALGPNSTLVLDAERQVRTSGSGFLPDTKVDLYVDPPVLLQTGTTGSWLRDAVLRAAQATLLGTFTVAADGTFAGTATLPDSILAGEHVLQAVGISPQRQTRALSLGIVVQPWIKLTKGPRKATGRYDTLRATGDTGGIEAGVKVTPRIRYSGQSKFSQGKAVITVASNGTFTWSRKIRPNRGLSAYIPYIDTASNKVYWAKVR